MAANSIAPDTATPCRRSGRAAAHHAAVCIVYRELACRPRDEQWAPNAVRQRGSSPVPYARVHLHGRLDAPPGAAPNQRGIMYYHAAHDFAVVRARLAIARRRAGDGRALPLLVPPPLMRVLHHRPRDALRVGCNHCRGGTRPYPRCDAGCAAGATCTAAQLRRLAVAGLNLIGTCLQPACRVPQLVPAKAAPRALQQLPDFADLFGWAAAGGGAGRREEHEAFTHPLCLRLPAVGGGTFDSALCMPYDTDWPPPQGFWIHEKGYLMMYLGEAEGAADAGDDGDDAMEGEEAAAGEVMGQERTSRSGRVIKRPRAFNPVDDDASARRTGCQVSMQAAAWVAWAFHGCPDGPWEEFEVAHRCSCVACLNPAHLHFVRRVDNQADKAILVIGKEGAAPNARLVLRGGRLVLPDCISPLNGRYM